MKSRCRCTCFRLAVLSVALLAVEFAQAAPNAVTPATPQTFTFSGFQEDALTINLVAAGWLTGPQRPVRVAEVSATGNEGSLQLTATVVGSCVRISRPGESWDIVDSVTISYSGQDFRFADTFVAESSGTNAITINQSSTPTIINTGTCDDPNVAAATAASTTASVMENTGSSVLLSDLTYLSSNGGSVYAVYANPAGSTTFSDCTPSQLRAPTRGTVTRDSPSAGYRYLPRPNIVPAGQQSVTDTFEVGVSNFDYPNGDNAPTPAGGRIGDPGCAFQSVALVTVTISGVNNAPAAVNDSAATGSGQSVEIAVLGNDSDPDSDPITITSIGQPINGAAAIVGSQIVYTPNAGYVGTDSFQYTVSDGALTSSATVSVTTSASQAPVTTGFSVFTLLNLPVAIDLTLNGRVSDADTPLSSLVVFDAGDVCVPGPCTRNGQVTFNGTQIIYSPAADFSGQDVIAYGVSDGINNSNFSLITVDVQASLPPLVSIEGGDRSIPDSDGQPGETVGFGGTANDPDGTVTVASFRWFAGELQITEADGQAQPRLRLADGVTVVTLLATDNLGSQATATVTITVGQPGQIADDLEQALGGITLSPIERERADALGAACSGAVSTTPGERTTEQSGLSATCAAISAALRPGPDQDAQAVRDALEEISGRQITAQQTTAIDFSGAQLTNIAARLRALRSGNHGFSLAGLGVSHSHTNALPIMASMFRSLLGGGSSADTAESADLLSRKLGVFLNGNARIGDKDATVNESGYDFDTKGRLTLGADYRVSNSLVLGLAAGYGRSGTEFELDGGSMDSDAYSGSLYGSWYGQKLYLDLIANYGRNKYESIRNISILRDAIRDRAIGSTQGTQHGFGVSAGYEYAHKGFSIIPTLAVNYVEVEVEGFAESADGCSRPEPGLSCSGLALIFEAQTATSLTVKAGGRMSYVFRPSWGVLTPQARIDFVREMNNEQQATRVRFAADAFVNGPTGPASSFTILTDEPDTEFLVWGLSLAAQFKYGFSGFVDYETVAALDSISSHELTVGLRYEAAFR